MHENLQKNGWALASHHLSKKILNELIDKKNKFLQVSSEEVKKAFAVEWSGFESDKLKYIELAKGITRAFLRYDPCSHLLAQAIWKELRENYKLGSEVKYLALPYPIIHLPLDTSESGTMHKDAYDYIKYFYTTWTPLGSYLHHPISVTEKTHHKNSFVLRQLRIRLPFINKFILSTKKILTPDIHLGEFFLWHGETDHQGLLNKSDDTTVAIVVRFTSSPIMSESTLTVHEIERYLPIETNIFTRELVQKMIRAFKEIQIKTTQDTEKEPCILAEEVREQINRWDFSPDELKRLAYVFGLWAQRMDNKKDVNLFYFYAIFCGTDNYFFLKKCIRHVLSNFQSKEAEKFIESILRDFPDAQTMHVIKDCIRISGEKGKRLDIKYSAEQPLLKSSLS